jgi:AcrR family transcriptional regulator
MNPYSQRRRRVKASARVNEQRREEYEARAQRIMDAAARVFIRRGVENATMEMIAREAGVAVGTIYLHFASRDEVYLTLRATFCKRLMEGQRQVKARMLEPLEEIRALASVYIEHLDEYGEPVLISQPVRYSDIRKRLRRASEIRAFDRSSEGSRELFQVFKSSIERAFNKALISDPLGPIGVSVAIWSMINGAFMLARDPDHLAHATGLAADGFLTKAFDSYLQGLVAAARNQNQLNQGQAQGTRCTRT